MKRILFTNPPKDLMNQLKSIGLVDFYEKSDINSTHLNGKGIIPIEGTSKNVAFGKYSDHKISNDENIKNNYDINASFWKTATMELSEKGVEILKQSGIKNWKIQ